MTGKKILGPSRTYIMTLKIKGEEYSNDLFGIRISSSLATGYQIVTLTLNITPNTILLNKLFGQDKIKLNIALQDHSEYGIDSLDFDLMILSSEFTIPVTHNNIEEGYRAETTFDLLTVTRVPFQIMTTTTNAVFGLTPESEKTDWTGPKTIKEMFETITKNYVPMAKHLEYDNMDCNPYKVLQCCIPPISYYKTFKYLDSSFGVYKGIASIFCDHQNIIKVMNLTARMKKNPSLYIEHLSHGDNTDEFKVVPKLKNHYITRTELSTNYIGNSKFGAIGKDIKHITLPSDNLFKKFTHSLTEICTKYGLVSQSKQTKTFTEPNGANRTEYYINDTGCNESENFIVSKISKEISNTSRLSLMIEKNLYIQSLLEIGSVAKLKITVQEHIDISGKYILFSSDIIWTRTNDWDTIANIELIRTNKI